MTEHVDDDLWNEFHQVVNMTSHELGEWLATDEAGAEGAEPTGPIGTPTGRAVLAVLAKRRTDVTADDAETMRKVVDRVRAERGFEPEPTAGDPNWRHRLMRLGHDPLRPV